MKKANAWVIVNGADSPDFGGVFESRMDMCEHYSKYDSFTQMVYSSLRAANRDRIILDESVEDGNECWLVCGGYVPEFSKDYRKRF